MARGRSTIRQTLLRLIPDKVAILVAVSGGKDSVALLHALIGISRQKKLILSVAHVNHSLRGREGNEAAKFVRDLASTYSLEYFGKKLKDPPARNIEAWGRDARYDFFSSIIRRRAQDWIVTAHTANDLSENYLMRLVSNKQLGSIAEKDESRRLIRPFLSVSRQSIDDYIEAHGLQWREDFTNLDTSFLRNKIRHSVLPFLRSEMGEAQVETLAERLSELADKEIAIQEIAKTTWQSAKKQSAATNLEAGSKDWVTCLRNTINALDYKCLKLDVVRIAFSEALGGQLQPGGGQSRLRQPGGTATAAGTSFPSKRKQRNVNNALRATKVSKPGTITGPETGSEIASGFDGAGFCDSGRLLSRQDSKNLLAWLERKVQAVNLTGRTVLRGERGGFKLWRL